MKGYRQQPSRHLDPVEDFYSGFWNFKGKGGGGGDVPPPAPAINGVGQIIAQQQATPSQFTPAGNLLQGSIDANGNFVQSTGSKRIPVYDSNGNVVNYETVDQAGLKLDLAPDQQQQFDLASDTTTQLAQLAKLLSGSLDANRLSFEGLPEQVSQIDSSGFGQAGQQVQDATFQQAMNLLQPGLDIADRRLEQELANTGAPLAGQLAQDRANLYSARQADLLGNVSLGSVQAGRQEQGRLFGEALQSAQLQNAGRATGIGEQLTGQSFDFNQLASLLGLQPIAQPGLNSFYAPPVPNAMGAFANETNQNALAQNAQIQNARNATSQSNSFMSGLFGLGQAGILAKFGVG